MQELVFQLTTYGASWLTLQLLGTTALGSRQGLIGRFAAPGSTINNGYL